jgi:hypothetical protein
MHPRALGDDERDDSGSARAVSRTAAPSAPLRAASSYETHVDEKVRDEVQAKKLDGHTHSRLSVICIIKEKRKREREREKECARAREREREKERETRSKSILYVYKLWTIDIEAVKRILGIIRI